MRSRLSRVAAHVAGTVAAATRRPSAGAGAGAGADRRGQRPPAAPAPRTPARAGGSSPPATRIEYTPCLDGDPDPGEVVWAWVPYEDDPSQWKDRPVAIFGRRGNRLVGVALTSKRRPDSAQFEVGVGPWDRDGRPSYAKLDRVLEIDPEKVRREGAVLDRRRFDGLVAALRRQHS